LDTLAICRFGISARLRLNKLVEEKDYSDSVVRSCFNNIRAITHLARKQKFLTEDPGEDVNMPITKLTKKPVLGIDLMLLLLGRMEDLGDLCLMLVGIFSGPRERGDGFSVEGHAAFSGD
jgi:hypothetical protein